MRWLTHSFALVPLAMGGPKIQAPPPAPTAPAQSQPDLKAQDQAADEARIARGTTGRESDVLTSPLGATQDFGSLARKALLGGGAQ